MKAIIKRYQFFLLFLLLNFVLVVIAPEIGKNSITLTGTNLLEMISILPPVFILLGLLDVWVERETMMKYMGENAGFTGALIAFLMGSAAAGPLYAAFPIASILLKKGVKLSNVFIFVGAWSTTKIPMILFEVSNLGVPYTILRLICNVIGIILIAFILEKTISKEEKESLYQNNLDK